eukprot:403364255
MKLQIALIASLIILLFSSNSLVKSQVVEVPTYANNCLGCLTQNTSYTYCAGVIRKCYDGLLATCTSTISDFVSSCGSDQCAANNYAFTINKVNEIKNTQSAIAISSKCSMRFTCQTEICRLYLTNDAGYNMRAYKMSKTTPLTEEDIVTEINPFGWITFRQSTITIMFSLIKKETCFSLFVKTKLFRTLGIQKPFSFSKINAEFRTSQIVGESKKRCKTLEPVEVPEIVKLIIDNTKSKAKKRKRNFNEEQKRNIVELDKIDEGKFLKSQLKEEIDQIRRQIHHKERTDNQLISIVQNLSIIAKKVLPSPKAEEKYMNHAKIQNSQIYLDVTTFDPSRGLSYQVNNKSTNSKIPQFPTLYSTDSQRNQVQIYTDDIDQSNSNQSLELSKQKQERDILIVQQFKQISFISDIKLQAEVVISGFLRLILKYSTSWQKAQTSHRDRITKLDNSKVFWQEELE